MTPFKSSFDLEQISPELKSFVYQSIQELEPFTTPETLIMVTAKDPLKLITQLEADGVDFDRTRLKKMYRIAISLTEEDTTIAEEGLHEDIYEAIRIAKDKLIKTLTEIQDDMMTNQDRMMQINSAMAGGSVH